MAYQLALIGFGGMGNWHYENITKQLSDIQVKGVFDIREEAMQKAEKAGLHCYKSMDEVLADPSIDIVTIATPNNFHKDIAIACMRAGKNVISEKPVTLNSEELMEIMAVSKETGKLFSVHQNRRWDKDYVTLKEILKQGTIGSPYFIESRVQGSRRAMHGWRSAKMNGGGMLLDWGVHLIDQMLNLIDSPVVEVEAHLFNIYCKECDDNIKVILRFENQVSALVEVSMNCFITQPRWHVSCTDGTALIEDWDANGKMIRLCTEEEAAWEDVIVYTAAGPTRSMAPRPIETTEQIELPAVQTTWTDFYRNIAQVLDGKAELIVKPEQCLRVMNVIDSAFLSNKLGQSIKCKI